MLINDLYTNKKPNLSEGMEGQVVFSGTGADGAAYEIIQSSPTDFMIHANGKHIDTYGSLQRAMSVLKNEVPGLQQGMAEGPLNELAPSSGEGGNGPFDYGSAIIEIGQNFVDNYADSAAGEDAADIIQVGKTFMSAGMTKGISALFAIDTQVYGHVLDELSSLGFNVDLDIVSKRRAPTLDRDAQNAMRAVQAKFDAQPGQVYLVTGHHEFGSSSGKIKATSPEAAKQKFIANAGMKFNKVDVASEQGMAEGLWDQHTSIPELEQAIKNLIMGYKGGVNLTDKGRAQLLLSINKGKRILAKKKQQQGMAEGTLDEAVGMMIKGAAISGDNDQDIADRIAAKTGGRVDSGAYGHHILITYPTTQDRAEAAVKIRKMFPGIELYKSGGNRNAIDEQGMAEGSELKQAKRKYNQAAKDANADQVGAGKKIDTMKKSLRQKDLGKEQGMAEDDDAVAAFMARGGEIQRLKPAKPRKGERWQGSAHIGAAGGRGTKGRVSGLGANTGKSGKPVVTAEDAAYDPFANDPAADAKHEADVFAKMKQQNQQGKGTKIKDMNPIDRDQYLKNTNRQWDDKTQRIVPATKPNVQEVSLGDYGKKAPVSRAGAEIKKFFGRDDPAAVAAADRTIANRTKGLARADARRKPYTAPPVDQDKQRRDLADKYPNIDELVRRAELNRDPQYDRADGPAYYNGRDAEHNYHRLKQIQRMIRGAELDEMDFGGVSQTTDSDTGDVTTNFNQGPLSVTQTKTPGGYTKQTDQQFDLGTATLGARTVGPNIGAGQLAGTTTKTATNTATGQAKQQVKGVGFGGASGATVGKNYVGASDDELAKHAADSVTGINEEPGQVTVDVPGSSFTADKSTNTLSGTTNVHGVNMNATKDMTPGGATTFSANMNVAPNLNIAATQKSADYNKGQLAGTKSVAAKYTDTTGALGKPGQQHTATRTAGVGFGGASGANVGKNYVDQYSVNESVDRIRHLAGIKPVR